MLSLDTSTPSSQPNRAAKILPTLAHGYDEPVSVSASSGRIPEISAPERPSATASREHRPRPRAVLQPEPPEAPSSNLSVSAPLPISRHARRKLRAGLTLIQERFWLLQKWHGQVLAVGTDDFKVQVFDPSDPSVVETATFQKNELAPENLKFLRPGATFYWFVGFRDRSDRQRVRESIIWMKRGTRISRETYAQELAEIEKLWDALGWAEPISPAGL
jgi:hypothetical protein